MKHEDIFVCTCLFFRVILQFFDTQILMSTGDLKPFGTYEVLGVICCMVIGCTQYSQLVGGLSDFIGQVRHSIAQPI